MYNFKKIETVIDSNALIDVVLSKTNRKTPTQNHAGWKISRIRKHQLKKVKFCAEAIYEKLNATLTQFPKLTEIHPFQADLLNILQDKDHYKIALSQINSSKNLIERVERDQIKLLKQSDSQYRSKTLKRAALGRMATILRKLKSTLPYLEQVRQHMSRLPAIDPQYRSLLIVGQPNVGKSSFMNAITCANVDVQNQPFTTKSLQLGHCDQLNNKWQVIDSPGILDHPVEEMNTVEMQSICSFAHLDACILFFFDPSETCGYLVQDQLALLRSVKPLFKNKPIIFVCSKSDLKTVEQMDAKDKEAFDQIFKDFPQIRRIDLSTLTQTNIGELKKTACELFTEQKLKLEQNEEKTNKILSRMHIAQPKKRDDIVRQPCIPANLRQVDGPQITAKELQEEMGGAGVFFIPNQQHFKLDNADWNFDKVPEFLDGMNVADFYDPEIEEKLRKLEEEEEELERNMAIEVDDPSQKFQKLKREQKRIKTYFKDRKFEREMEDNFRSKKKATGEKIMDRLKRDTKLPAEVKQKIQARLQQHANDSDSGSGSGDDDSGSDDSDTRKSTGREERGKQSKKLDTEVRRKFKEKIAQLKKRRNHPVQGEADKSMEDESNEDREKRRKLEILKVKESKLKRKISKDLKSRGKYDETDHRVPTKRPQFLFSGKRSGFKHDWR